MEIEYLAYSHKTLSIERLYFISFNYALGIGKQKNNSQHPLYLLDKHNLVRDTFYTEEEPMSVILANDSTIFVQQLTKTIELLVRRNRILLKSQLTIPDVNGLNPNKILSEPLFIGHRIIGKSYQDKRALSKNEYCLKMIDIAKGLNEERDFRADVLIYPSSPQKKKSKNDLQYALFGELFYVYQPSSSKFIHVNLEENEVTNETLLNAGNKANFLFDHICGKGYISKPSNSAIGKFDLFLINNEQELVFQESMEELPFGIVGNRVHIIKKKKDQYFHHLIPLAQENGIEKNNLLQEVQILSH